MNTARVLNALLLFPALLLSACTTVSNSPSPSLAAQGDATLAEPPAARSAPLGEDDPAPVATLLTPAGDRVNIRQAYRNGPTVLIFYRGGWCPYCNAHLSDLATIEPELRDLGFQIVAVSPDRPEELRETLDEHELGYQLLSDQDMVLARAFGVAFRVDDETLTKYESYGIDLQAASGRSHYQLPVPAVFIIDRAGAIRFSHRDEDYTQRLSGEALLAAARRIAAE